MTIWLQKVGRLLRRLFGNHAAHMPVLDYDTYWVMREDRELGLLPREAIFIGWLEAGSRVLDVGCGDGTFAAYLQNEHHCTVCCVDISPEAIQRVVEKGLEGYVLDISRDSVSKQFDVVILSEVIEHLSNPEEVILRLKNQAKYLYVSIPNIAYFEHRLRLLFGRFPVQWGLHPSEHLRFWSRPDFVAWCEHLGLVIEDIKVADGLTLLRKVWPNLFADGFCFKLRRSQGRLGREHGEAQ